MKREHCPERRRHNTARSSSKQADPDAVLDFAQRLADRRLRNAERFGYCRDAVLLRELDVGQQSLSPDREREDGRIVNATRVGEIIGKCRARRAHLGLGALYPQLQRAADIGEHHSMRVTLEQLGAKRPFQLLNGTRHRRLRAAQRLARFGDAAGLGHGRKRAQMTRVQQGQRLFAYSRPAEFHNSLAIRKLPSVGMAAIPMRVVSSRGRRFPGSRGVAWAKIEL